MYFEEFSTQSGSDQKLTWSQRKGQVITKRRADVTWT